jgi:hypothetical protein
VGARVVVAIGIAAAVVAVVVIVSNLSGRSRGQTGARNPPARLAAGPLLCGMGDGVNAPDERFRLGSRFRQRQIKPSRH